MLRIDFNSGPVDAALARTEAALEDPTPMHQDIGEYMIAATRVRFQRSQAPDGTKWLPKKATTLKRYVARGDGNRPNPLIGVSQRLSQEILSFASRDEVEIGSNLEYAAIHQFGGVINHPGGTPYFIDSETGLASFVKKDSPGAAKLPRTAPHAIPIPKRVWLGVSDKDEAAIVAIADEYLAGAIDG